MKKLLSAMHIALFMLIAGFASTALAQNTGYEITMPKIGKIITVTKNGVNLRKAPNAQAPRMVWVCQSETDNCWYTWSNERKLPGHDYSPMSAGQGTYFLVVSETPQWYGITVSGLTAYISKQFAKEVTMTPITPETLRKTGYYGYDMKQAPGISTGKYKGYVMLNIAGFESDGCMIGHIHNGLVVFTHNVPLYPSFSAETVTPTLTKSESGYGWNLTYGKSASLSETDDFGTRILDVNKIGDKTFAEILRVSGATTKANESVTIYANINGEIKMIAEISVKDIPIQNRVMVRF